MAIVKKFMNVIILKEVFHKGKLGKIGLLNTDELTVSISFSYINKRKPANNSNS